MVDVIVDGSSLTVDEVITVARENARVIVDKKALARTARARKVLENMVGKDRALFYGINTGFGAMSHVTVARDQLEELQVNLIRSHAMSVGDPCSPEVVRAMMLLRANALLKGNSGVRPEIIEVIISLLNKRVHPEIPRIGSVGASGDLSPLSHMALVLMGEGKAEYRGRMMSGKAALKAAGLMPVRFGAKEGLALNNGTQQTTAMACLCLHDAENLILTSIAVLALSLESLNGWMDAFDERIHKLRAHNGQVLVASDARKLLAGSGLVRTVRSDMPVKGRPQDPYSFRCAPQVMGTAVDAFEFARRIIDVEVSSVTDNPLLFPDDRVVLSGGNFHAQPVAMAMDVLALGFSTLANISERRISALLDPSMNNGLPPFLVGRGSTPGLASGLMAAQYTATALVAENKVLAHPASSDSIPTSGNFEDFVSMGPGAAMKAQRVLDNTIYVIAIELLVAAQGVDLRIGQKRMGKGTRKVYRLIREQVPSLQHDRSCSDEIELVKMLLKTGSVAAVVRESV